MRSWRRRVRGQHHYDVEPGMSPRLHHCDAIIIFLGRLLDVIEEFEAEHASWNGIGGSERIKEPDINSNEGGVPLRFKEKRTLAKPKERR
jgi:hypothetical protein